MPRARAIVDRLFRLERMGEVQAFLAAQRRVGRRESAPTRPRGTRRSTRLGPTRGRRRTQSAAATAAVSAALGRVYARDAALFAYGPPAPPHPRRP